MITCENCGYANKHDALYCNLCKTPFKDKSLDAIDEVLKGLPDVMPPANSAAETTSEANTIEELFKDLPDIMTPAESAPPASIPEPDGSENIKDEFDDLPDVMTPTEIGTANGSAAELIPNGFPKKVSPYAINKSNSHQTRTHRIVDESLVTLEREGYYQVGFFRRFTAFLLDGFIFLLLCFLLFINVKPIEQLLATAENRASLIAEIFIFMIVYDCLFLIIFKATPGMMLLDLKIVRTDFTNAGFLNVLLRVLTTPLSNKLIIGVIWSFLDSQNQMLHDKISDTFTVGRDLKFKRLVIALISFAPFVYLLSNENRFQHSLIVPYVRIEMNINSFFETRFEKTNKAEESKEDIFKEAEDLQK